MASRASFSDDSRIIKRPLPKSLLLKDYLLDDLSSCSSNGFRSYPRRQCCTSVRLLVEIDLNKHCKMSASQKQSSQLFLKSKSKSKSKTPSVLYRASAAVINAFKQFPFSAAGKPMRANFLPRSLSRKLSKHGFWKRTGNNHNKEIKRLKSFGELMNEKENTPPTSPLKFSTAITRAELNSSTSNSNSNSWSDSDFTAASDSFTTGNSSEVNSAQNDVVKTERDLPEKKTTNEKKVGGTTATATNYSAAIQNAKEKWHNEEKEQFSPVSVMDFPDDNDLDDVSSSFQHIHLCVEGTKRKTKNKTRRFEALAKLEPVKLEYRIALSELVTESASKSTYLEYSQEDNQIKKKAMALLQLMKTTLSSHNLFKSKVIDAFLVAVFMEKIAEGNITDYEMLKVAKDWMNGQQREMFLDWHSQKNRHVYIKDMEKRVKWSKYDDEVEKGEVALEMEHEVFSSLIDEILLDFHL